METMYIVLEIKTVEHEGGYATITSNTQHTKRESADSQYYTRLAAAANPNNTNPKHAVVLMTNEGFVLENRCYTHEPEPEPEPTTEGEDGTNAQVGDEGGSDGSTDAEGA